MQDYFHVCVAANSSILYYDLNVDEYPSCVCEFTDEEVIQATNDMNFLIGKGEFGRVYRGSYHGTEVAVKILDVVSE